MKNELRNFMGRAKRYDNIDGTSEICIGLALLGFAVAGYLQASLPKNASRPMQALVMYAGLIPALGLGYWIRRIIKRRITWPRTGYVACGPVGKSRRNRMIVGWLVGGIVGTGVACLLGYARRHGLISVRAISLLAIYVVLCVCWVLRMGREHAWKWLVLVFSALGLLAIALIVPGGVSEQQRPAMLFLGLVWLASGGATLYSYLRHTQPPAPEGE